MSLNGTVTKALLVITPEFATKANIAETRHKLFDDGFIVVREEVRNINAELATKLTANELHSGSAAANIQGECFVIVVARTKAAELLYEFSQVSSPHPKAFFCCRAAQDATRGVVALFPQMMVDPIPDNAEARDYIQAELKQVIIQGLTETAKNKPDNSIEFFAKYLLEHNPHSPPVSSATE